ncbi:hypothetical protein [Streptomyces ipomoeae]|uniref:hypothetical protein n=1 Tax=Streptomyces ipomoeae TaxID=103232 RepID=UPI00114611D6|nr:hypothetical protein [Streptomyces ipomoeae]MDX2935585.1 hypothetical protein [Streptomyces ipomoeae]TQE18395.1 hypothetical protein SipoB123_34145 [Streptomyces ipomoeae]
MSIKTLLDLAVSAVNNLAAPRCVINFTFAPQVTITTGDIDILEDVLEYLNIGKGSITLSEASEPS